MKSSDVVLTKRGYVYYSYVITFSGASIDALNQLLMSEVATERTVGAIIIGQNKYSDCVETLCAALKVEKALYSKIAITEALANIGKAAVLPLVKLLGEIGTNQHKKLPTKPFNKKSYPLPRDIAARTLVKIGTFALNDLEVIFKTGCITQVSEAIDVFGHICFNIKSAQSSLCLLKCYKKYCKHDIIIWKILRAFSAFNEEKIYSILEDTIENSKTHQHVWEAKRSLIIISRCIKIA